MPESKPASFTDKLSALCSFELADAQEKHDSDRVAVMIERLAHSLAFTVAMTAKGNAEVASKLMEGATVYALEEATRLQKVGAFMAVAQMRFPGPN
jgi:hypothetical protein